MWLDRIALGAAVCGALFLAFVWGIVTVKTDLPPNGLITRIEAGFDALGKMEKKRYPRNMIRLAEAGETEQIIHPAPPGGPDLILMTGGFFSRTDICPRFGCIAYVMDRDGQVLKTWEYDPGLLFTKENTKDFSSFPGAENFGVEGLDLLPDGGLVVTFQGRNIFPYQVGIAKFSWSGELEWLRMDHSHHWPKVGDDGNIYVAAARVTKAGKTVAATQAENNCKFGAVFDEGVRVISPGGELLSEFWIDDLVRKSDRQGLVYSVRDDCDPHHVNYVTPINAAAAARIPGAEAGDLLISLRSSSSLIVVDRIDGTIHRILNGPMVAQHSPQVLSDGRIALFDNLGGIDTNAGTRILVLDPATGTSETMFPKTDEGERLNLFSEAAGHIEFCAEGKHALIAETLGGRVFEIDVASGKVLWGYRSISDVSRYFTYQGESVDGPIMGLMQTRGADYLSRSDFERFSAASG